MYNGLRINIIQFIPSVMYMYNHKEPSEQYKNFHVQDQTGI